METIVVISVVVITLVTLLVTFFAYLRSLKRHQSSPQLDISDLEERVLELVNRFQHISATRINTFETKIKEMNQLIQQANEYYLRLTSVISEAYKVESEIMERTRKAEINTLFDSSKEKTGDSQKVVEYAVSSVSKIPESKEPRIEQGIDIKSSSIEHKILNMATEGQNADEIAKELQIGKGEVQLVLELFRRKNK